MGSRLLKASLGILLILVLTSCGGNAESGGSAAPEPAADTSPDVAQAAEDGQKEEAISCDRARGAADATVIAIDKPGGVEFDWKPGNVAVAAGQEVVLEVVNRSYAVHDFSSGDCYSGNISPEKATKISFVMPEHPVSFYCALHAQSMTGKLLPG